MVSNDGHNTFFNCEHEKAALSIACVPKIGLKRKCPFALLFSASTLPEMNNDVSSK